MINEIPSKALYHYTPVNGFLGICQSKSIWASDIRYLNDAKEFSHAIELIRFELRQCVGTRGFSEIFFDYLLELLENIQTQKIYVASFSEVGDLLSQWRGYCPPGAGYCIGIDPKYLKNIAKNNGFKLNPCIYDSEQKKSIVTTFVDKLFYKWRDNNKQFDNSLETFFSETILEMAPLFKHESFIEEKEWRVLFHQSNKNPASNIGFRAGIRKLIPYLDFELRYESDEICFKEIIVGPTDNSDLAINSVVELLNMENIVCENVISSQATYRGW